MFLSSVLTLESSAYRDWDKVLGVLEPSLITNESQQGVAVLRYIEN